MVWRVKVVVLMWEEEVVWSVFVGVLFGSVFGIMFESVFVEVFVLVLVELVSSGLVFGAEVKVEVVGSVWVV